MDKELLKGGNGRGGVRVPGEGKSLGRPPFPEKIKRKQFTAKLDPKTIQELKVLAADLGLSQGQVIDKAIFLLASQ